MQQAYNSLLNFNYRIQLYKIINHKLHVKFYTLS